MSELREEFEKWFRQKWSTLNPAILDRWVTLRDGGAYLYEGTRTAWEAYQAGAATAVKPYVEAILNWRSVDGRGSMGCHFCGAAEEYEYQPIVHEPNCIVLKALDSLSPKEGS